MRVNKWGIHAIDTWHIYRWRKHWSVIDVGDREIYRGHEHPKPNPSGTWLYVIDKEYSWPADLDNRKEWNFEYASSRYNKRFS